MYVCACVRVLAVYVRARVCRRVYINVCACVTVCIYIDHASYLKSDIEDDGLDSDVGQSRIA